MSGAGANAATGVEVAGAGAGAGGGVLSATFLGCENSAPRTLFLKWVCFRFKQPSYK